MTKSQGAIAARAAELVGGERDKTHGDTKVNFRNIASMWNTYIGIRAHHPSDLTPEDVAVMMTLLKIARMQTGKFNPDDYVDGCGYLSLAGFVHE